MLKFLLRPKVLIAGFAAFFIGGLLLTFTTGLGSYLFDRSAAERGMHRHIESVFTDHKFLGGACMNVDSDGDGYVSCTARTANKQGIEQTHALECAGAMTLQNGCRSQRAQVIGRQP
ncbi:hypothetical protein HYV74_02635 [Candidatus Uhrbacteria bacterium]|nr:hypothetical protein [Candidatus Uhrbacteria bacterium]